MAHPNIDKHVQYLEKAEEHADTIGQLLDYAGISFSITPLRDLKEWLKQQLDEMYVEQARAARAEAKSAEKRAAK